MFWSSFIVFSHIAVQGMLIYTQNGHSWARMECPLRAIAAVCHKRPLAKSFDQLIGEQLHRGWDSEAECLGGLEVYHELVFHRRLHRKVGGFLATQDAVDIRGR